MAETDRLAGDIFGTSILEGPEQSQSVLAKYFPELGLSASVKGRRGGRLGRGDTSTELPTREIKFTPTAPAFVGPSKPETKPETKPEPQAQVPAQQFANDEINRTLLGISKQLEGLKGAGASAAPQTITRRDTRVFTPRNPNPSTPEEAVTYLYETQLGRTPTAAEVNEWTKVAEFSDKSLTAQEWDALRGVFQGTPEYKSLSESVPASTPRDVGRTFASAPSPSPAPAPAPAPAAPQRNFTPDNPNPQTPEEAVKFVYQTQLGRTPAASEIASWTSNPIFADRSLSESEWGSLVQGFRSSPEYLSLQR